MARAAIERAFHTAQTAGWNTFALRGVLAGLQLVFDGRPDEQPIALNELRAMLGATGGVRLARMAQVLDDLGLLVDDIVPTMRSWVEDRAQMLPAGFRPEVRAWLLVLLEGDARARPRSASTLYGYFGRAFLPAPAGLFADPGQLREVTEDDVRAASDSHSSPRVGPNDLRPQTAGGGGPGAAPGGVVDGAHSGDPTTVQVQVANTLCSGSRPPTPTSPAPCSNAPSRRPRSADEARARSRPPASTRLDDRAVCPNRTR